MILLDTNVLSESMNVRPEPAVLTWIDSQPSTDLWTSVIVVAEIISGLEQMPPGKRALELRVKAERMLANLFAGRICVLDERAARAYGVILKHRKRIGRPIDEMDALIAAAALVTRATLATRNTTDFEDCGIQLVNPWNQA